MLENILKILGLVVDIIKSFIFKKEDKNETKSVSDYRNDVINNTSNEWLRKFGGTNHKTSTTSNDGNNNN